MAEPPKKKQKTQYSRIWVVKNPDGDIICSRTTEKKLFQRFEEDTRYKMQILKTALKKYGKVGVAAKNKSPLLIDGVDVTSIYEYYNELDDEIQDLLDNGDYSDMEKIIEGANLSIECIKFEWEDFDYACFPTAQIRHCDEF